MRHPKDLELEEKYQQALANGETTLSMDKWMGECAKAGISAKIKEHEDRVAQLEAEREKDKPHTYAEITRAIPKALAKINELKDKPNKMVKAKKAELNKEFDKLVKIETCRESQRELWINEQVVKFMGSVEYMRVKQDLTYQTNLYSECLALKEEWEKENADIIEAERIRSKRAELLQADPETLRALGITPDPTFTATPKVEEENPQTDYENALRALHPSATDGEIKFMLSQVYAYEG